MIVTILGQGFTGTTQPRWPDFAALTRAIRPHVVCLYGAGLPGAYSERPLDQVGWLALTRTAWRRTRVGYDLNMRRMRWSEPGAYPAALGWRAGLRFVGGEVSRHDTQPDYRVARFDLVPGGPPVVVVFTYLKGKVMDAGIVAFTEKELGGLGIIIGDIGPSSLGNSQPQAAARVFADVGLTEVAAAHVSDTRGDLSLNGSLLRTDRVYVTPALVPAVQNRQMIDRAGSGCYGILVTLDTDHIDLSTTAPA